ncbi:MAG TPA: histidinol-phosphate transaminase [Burkholderiales bacterium]|nr:histidinol-phosphate transaminase [Burkholderiales bacterium]
MKRDSVSQALASALGELVREDILELKAYHVAPATGMVKLDAMENPYGLPPDLREAVGAVAASLPLNRYPNPNAPELKARLREAFALPADMGLLLGNGSDEIITMIAQTLARPGAVMLAPEPSFAMYRMNAIYSRMRYVGVPLAADFSLDVGAFLEAMQAHRPALIFIAYPNNPTGNAYAEAEVLRILDAATGFVVLDEAYHAFAGKSFMDRIAQYPNLMVMRTVSKLGLAGIRLGYAVARSEWIEQFDKLRPPYNVNVMTQFVAEKVLSRLDVLTLQAERIKAERAKLFAALATFKGLEAFPSEANFILVRVADANKTYGEMQARGVLIRNLHGGHPLLDQCLRLTVGTPEENQRLLEALQESV